MLRFLVPLAAVLLLTACEPDRQPPAEGGLVVEDAWVRPTRGAGSSSAAYFVLRNQSGEAARLAAVEADVAEAVEIHESVEEAGVMRMRPVEAVDVLAGGSVAFEPGGLHVMLIRVQRDLADGDSLRLKLVFEDGTRTDVPAVVRPAVF